MKDINDLSKTCEVLNTLINNNQIKFNFYNSYIMLDLLQCCYNKKENIIELNFRDTVKEHLEELEKLDKKLRIKRDENLNDYIDEQIDDNYYLIEQNPYYQDRKSKFDNLYDNLYSKLQNDEDKKTLENIYALLNNMSALENYLAYNIGKRDGAI